MNWMSRQAYYLMYTRCGEAAPHARSAAATLSSVRDARYLASGLALLYSSDSDSNMDTDTAELMMLSIRASQPRIGYFSGF
jgi:hypothetical protein